MKSPGTIKLLLKSKQVLADIKNGKYDKGLTSSVKCHFVRTDRTYNGSIINSVYSNVEIDLLKKYRMECRFETEEHFKDLLYDNGGMYLIGKEIQLYKKKIVTLQVESNQEILEIPVVDSDKAL